MTDRYTFGDNALALRRLEVLAEVFDHPWRTFVAPLVADAGSVLDLGCGPGLTTLALGPSAVGVERSPAFAAAARARGVTVIEADVCSPASLPKADLAVCRYLLSHLSSPCDRLTSWLSAAPVVACQETESITTDHPVMARYDALQQAMLVARGQALFVGPALAEWASGDERVASSSVRTFTPPFTAAVGLCAMNLPQWRTDPWVLANCSSAEVDSLQASLDALVAGSDDAGTMTWGLREVVLRR